MSKKKCPSTLLSCFALITISTVGLGDILPAGHMRAISGIAALTGFLMISCTAQYVYQTMSEKEN